MTRRPPQFSSEFNTHTIRIQSEKSGCLLSFLLFWLTGWAGVGGTAIVMAVRALLSGQDKPSIGSVSGAGLAASVLVPLVWLAATLGVGYAIIWLLFGQEVVTLAGGELRIREQTGPWGTTQRYDIYKIRYLRAQPDEWPTTLSKLERNDWGSGSVLFDYENVTVRFGKMLREAEARRVVAFLQQHRVGGG